MQNQRIYNYDDLNEILDVEDTDFSAYTDVETYFFDPIQTNMGQLFDGTGSLREHPTKNLFVFQWERAPDEDEEGHAQISFAIAGDEEIQNIGHLEFDVINPRLHVFSNQDFLIPSSDSDLSAMAYTEQQAVVNQAHVIGIAFDDNGVAQDLISDAAEEVILVEMKGEGEVHSPEASDIDRIDEDIVLRRSITQGSVNIPGVYRAIVSPLDKTGYLALAFVGHFNNNEINLTQFEIRKPTANLSIFPGGMDISKDMNTIYSMVLVQDTYGRPLTNLTSLDDHFIIEFDKEEIGFTEFSKQNVIGSAYIAEYGFRELGMIPVKVWYNEYLIAEDSFFVIDGDDTGKNTYDENYEFNYQNFKYNKSYLK